MEAVECSSLLRVINRRLDFEPTAKPNPLQFAVLADPQLGLLDSFIRKRPLPHQWDEELVLVDEAIAILNRLSPEIQFVIICGDLVNAQPGSVHRVEQIRDLLQSLNKLNPATPLITLPGNHDVGDRPTTEMIGAHTNFWGNDYYSFQVDHVNFLVLNSQYFWNSSNCEKDATEFGHWLDDKLSKCQQERAKTTIVFQHIPFFIKSVDEPDDYFNVPLDKRIKLLTQFYEAGVRHVFTGHLHKNVTTVWAPNPKALQDDPIHLITTSALCVQLGSDEAGFRLVRINETSGRVQHAYTSLKVLNSTESLTSDAFFADLPLKQ